MHISFSFFTGTAGSPADFCQLKVEDEILSVNSTEVSHMDQSQWEAAIDNALETGNLIMDVRRYGKKGEFFLCGTCQVTVLCL